MAQPHGTWGTSVMYTAAWCNAESLTHWARPGINPHLHRDNTISLSHWATIATHPLCIFNRIVWFFDTEFCYFFSYFWNCLFFGYVNFIYILSPGRLAFCFGDGFFCCIKTFHFDVISFVYFCCCFPCLRRQIQKNISKTDVKKYTDTVFFICFIVTFLNLSL